MPYALGIDLGTTNSVVAVYRRGVPESLPIDGSLALPSVASFLEDGRVLVGRPAKARVMIDPENTIASVKRSMGDRQKAYRVRGKSLTPVGVSSMILKRIVEGARSALGEPVRDAVITIPAYFNEVQAEDTRRAGEEAGLNVLLLEREPTAAAIAYGIDQGKDQTVMVYDLGGGTFDISIIEVKGNCFTVVAVGGVAHLGGDDFDEALMRWAAERFRSGTGLDVLDDHSPVGRRARQQLKEAAEGAKIELSQSDRSRIDVPDCMGRPLSEEISLEQYNSLIAPLLGRTIDCMRSVLRDARLDPDDIGRVLLVGGSTRNRAVRELIRREIKEPYTAERVDEVVAHGAAIRAAGLFLPEEAPDRPGRGQNLPEVVNVTAHTYGVRMIDDSDRLLVGVIIPRQTRYPCRRGILGWTHRPLQTQVDIAVVRGEDPHPDRNDRLGELILPVSRPRPERVPVGAIFNLDISGIIEFTAVELPLGPEISPICDYAATNNGALDLQTVDALTRSGKAPTRRIEIRSGEAAK